MTRRTLSLVVGGGFALVALLAVLTAAPVRADAERTSTHTIASEASDSGTACAALGFTATVHYTVTRPVIDVWGLRVVGEVTLDPAEFSVNVTEECLGSVAGVGGAAFVALPTCETGLDEGAAEAVAETSVGTACDEQLAYFSVAGGERDTEVSHSYYGEQRLIGDSGVGRGLWCLVYSSQARYASLAATTVAAAQTTDGDLCLDVS
jgi:hypothetical protein